MSENSLVKLLVLDGELQITKSLTRLLRKEFTVVAFNDSSQALSYLEQHSVCIVLIDIGTPKLNGVQFLSKVNSIQPNAIRIAMSGDSNYRHLTHAINEGCIHRLVEKPWDIDDLKSVLGHYKAKNNTPATEDKNAQQLERENAQLHDDNRKLGRYIEQEKLHLNRLAGKYQTLVHRYQSLTEDTLQAIASVAASHSWYKLSDLRRVALHARQLATYMNLPEDVIHQTFKCAMIHPIGLAFSKLENQSVSNFSYHHVGPCCYGQNIEVFLKDNLSFSDLTDSIWHQDENYDGTGFPERLSAEKIPLISRLLRVVKDYDYLTVTNCNFEKLRPPELAAIFLREKSEIYYDPEIVRAYLKMLDVRPQDEARSIDYSVGLYDINPGDELKRDLLLSNGKILIKSGSKLNEEMLQRLAEMEKSGNQKFAYLISATSKN